MDASYVSVKQKIPEAWTQSEQVALFFARLKAASSGLLMLDYDGTLSPFVQDRLLAHPYPGVRERLERLIALDGNRVVLISGRKARELQSLIALDRPIEIWGSHGREHLALDGSYSIKPLTEYEQEVLDQMKTLLEQEFALEMLECKPNSIAVHWRGAESRRFEITARVAEIYRRLVSGHKGEGKLQMLPFDGGIELRAGRVHKGNAVEQLLGGLPDGAVAAFLGDDTTDEDAFAALRGGEYEGRSLAVLVRSEPRDSFAQVWLKPPQELLHFLDKWMGAVEGPR
jgi:trehalose-phosphatase